MRIRQLFEGLLGKIPALASSEPAAIDIHFHYFVPHVPELLGGGYPGFIGRMEARWPLAVPPGDDGFSFRASVNPSVPLLVSDYMLYGAVKLLHPKLPSREQCLAVAKKWLTQEQLAGIENGRMAAVIGVSKCAGGYAVTIAAVAEKNKP